jgi:hypothetical protein
MHPPLKVFYVLPSFENSLDFNSILTAGQDKQVNYVTNLFGLQKWVFEYPDLYTQVYTDFRPRNRRRRQYSLIKTNEEQGIATWI